MNSLCGYKIYIQYKQIEIHIQYKQMKHRTVLQNSQQSILIQYLVLQMEFNSSSYRAMIIAWLVFMFICFGRSEAMRRYKNGRPANVSTHENWRKNSAQTLEFPNMPNPCQGPRRRTEMKDYLCRKPIEFSPSYKNPCWRGENLRLRCLPYFHLFGMSKSGTTDLFQRLFFHPEIIPNKGLAGKEITFWTEQIFKTGNKSLLYYTNSFFTKEIENAVDENGYHYKITGHGDPHDMWDRFLDTMIPQNDPKAEELMWTMPFVEHHLNPGVKLLLMLRDPVERLYSVFYFAKQGTTAEQFDSYVRRDLMILNHCLKYYTLRYCILNKRMKDQFKTRIYSSFYSELLRDWLKAFPREQILIMRNEDYAKDIEGTLTKIFSFLNVSMPDPKTIKFMAQLPHARVTQAKKDAKPMTRSTRKILTRLYRPSMEELAKMIGDEKFTFKDIQQIHN